MILFLGINKNNFISAIPLAAAVIAALLALGSRNCTANPEESPTGPQTRIAIIGGGISGSFAAKYLSEYDVDCSLDITIFDPPAEENHQGSRVVSHVLEDGTVIEMGASVLSRGFSGLVDEMIEGSSRKNNPQRLSTTTKPGTTGFRNSLGVCDGTNSKQQQQQAFPLFLSDDNTNRATSSYTAMAWRYNLDLWRILKATETVLEAFEAIYDCLGNTDDESTFFDSPNDIWEAVGLSEAVSLSFEEYLATIHTASSMSWWRKLLEPFLGDQGLLSSELCEPANILYHHQLNDQVTGLAGLVNFVSTFITGDDDDNDDDDGSRNFAIDGGNQKLIETAFAQASDIRTETCSDDSSSNSSSNNNTIKRLPIKIQTLVSSDFQQTIELFGTDGTVVDQKPYDVVVVATPLQLSGIEFMGKGSVFDEGLLYYLPLNEMVNSETSDANLHNHIHSLGGDHHLPSSVKRPYQPVVTTIITNGDIDPSYFFGSEESNSSNTNLPQSILFTKEGFDRTGLSSISQITKGVYKVLSSTELSETKAWEIFGDTATIEHTKVWGGPNGGAIPSFGGAGEASVSTRFLLYNGGRQDDGDNNDEFQSPRRHHKTKTKKKTTHAIYYTNAMESAMSSIEISAIGSKSVAKLIARRLGLVSPKRRNTNGEEL